jgi:hypothetical protein
LLVTRVLAEEVVIEDLKVVYGFLLGKREEIPLKCRLQLSQECLQTKEYESVELASGAGSRRQI